MTKLKHSNAFKTMAIIFVFEICAAGAQASVHLLLFNPVGIISILSSPDSYSKRFSLVDVTTVTFEPDAIQIECPKDISTYTDINECTAEISSSLNPEVLKGTLAKLTWTMEGATEATSSLSGINQIGHFIFNEGVTFVRYTGTDNAGNSVQCSFTVVVSDNQAPEISAPINISIQCNDRIPSPHTTLQAFFNAGGSASDNCNLNPVTFKLESEQKSNSDCPYTITRTYQISDWQGNLGKVKQLIIVEGKEIPVSNQGVQVLTLKSGMAEFVAVTNGDWNDAATWGGAGIPGLNDNVTIQNGVTVAVNVAAVCNNLTNNGTLNGAGNTLQINGDWTNNGTYNGGTNGIVEFTGTSNAVISGITNFEDLKISKGSISSTLTINGTATVLSSGALTVTSGLVTIPSGGSFTVNPAVGISIPAIAGFDVTGGSFTTGNFTITNNGLIRISSGTANFGSISGNEVHTQVDGAFIVSGGNVNIAGRFYNSAAGTLNPPNVSSGISISGGTVTLATSGNGLSSVGSLNVTPAGNFIFTGGTIVFQNPSSAATELDLGLTSGGGTKNTVGGTFQFGNGFTPAGSVFDISSNVPINRITSSGNADLKLSGDLLVNQLVLNSSSSLNLNGNSLQLAVSGFGNYTFPIDNGSGVLIPVTINLTGGSVAGGAYIEIETTGTKLSPGNKSSLNYLNRYWTVTSSGITTPVYDVTATYADADITGNENGIAIGSWGGSLPWTKGNAANTGVNTISVNGITANSFVFTGITLAPPTVTISATDAVICMGEPTTLTANPVGDTGFTYVWTSTPAGFNSTDQTVTVNPASTITYNVTVTDGNGFTATDDIIITVNPLPTLTGGSQSAAVCENNAATINLTGLLPGSTFTLIYSINGVAQAPIAGLSADGSGSGSFNTPLLTAGNNGQTLQITGITVTSATPNCSASFAVDVILDVNSNPVFTVCPTNQSVNNNAGLCSAVVTYTATASGDPAPSYSYTYTGATTTSGSGTGSGSAFNVGTTNITVNAENICGIVTCTFTVTVNDTENPVITCPGNISVNVDAGTCGAIVNYTSPIGTDNCAGATTVQTAGLAAGSTFPVGVTTNTFVVTDAAGNTATCSFTVTVTDNESPAINCLPTITVNNSPGFCYATATLVNLIYPVAIDNCNPNPTETPSRSDGLAMNANYPVGTTTITWTASDGTNSSTCTQTITVIDNEAPTFTVPGNITIYTDASCIENRDPAQTGNPINPKDNCTPLAGLMIEPSDGAIVPGSCTGNYSFTRTWTVTDAAENSTSKDQIITVRDNIRPVISVPPNVSIACSDSQDPDDTGWATATDNCSTPIITFSDSLGNPSMSCARNYTIFRNWLAKDLCGNQRSGVQRISVSDTKGPEVVFANQIVNVDCPDDIPGYYENLGQFLASHSLNDANDLCSGSVTMELYNEFSYFDSNTSDAGYCPESVQRTYRFYDECLNYTDVEQTIIITDLSDCTCTECTEQVEVHNVDLRGNPDGEWTLDNERRDKGARCCLDDVWWEEGGKDPYRCVSFNVIIDEGAIGVQIVTSKGQDSKEWRVDCEPVSLEGPGSNIICLPSGEYHLFSHCKQGGDGIDYIIRSVSGLLESDDISTRVNCLQQISTTGDYTGDPVWSALNPLYDKYLDTTDPHNPSFFVPLEDKDDVPATIQYEVCAYFDHYICGINVDGTVCDTITVHVLEAIEIELNIDPSLICENDPLTLIADLYPASSYYVYEWYDGPGATGYKFPTSTNTLNLSPPVPLGTYSLKVIDYDPSGLMCNFAVFDFEVQADDTPASVFSPSDDLYIECNDPSAAQQIQDWLATATAEDDLGNPLDVTNDYNGISHACGTELPVVFTAVDICGNIGTDTAYITVEDNTASTWVTAAGDLDRTLECSDVDGLAVAQAMAPVPTDECDDDATLVPVKTSGDFVEGACPNAGTYTNTWTVTDACGNISEVFTQIVILTDTQAPVLTGGANGTGECEGTNPGQNTAYIAWRDGFAGITATDACGTSTITVVEGAWTAPTVCTDQITVTFTATDVCGNDVSVDYTYTITDATIPFIINGTNGSAECQGTIPGANTDYIIWRDQFANASTNDVCGNSTLSYSEGSWLTIDPCTVQTTVTVTATDDCGLIQTAQFTFTITDIQEPVLIGGANGTGECEGSDPSLNTAYLAWRNAYAGITSTDACGTSTITVVEGAWTAPTVCTDEITVTFTATDVCGNDVSVDYIYTITDATIPFIINGTNGSAECQGTIPGANTDYITWRDQFANASTNDVCGNSTLSYTENPWVTINDCTVQTTVTVTATDDCGLTETADFTFTITDSQAPVLTGGANGTGECEGTNPGQNTAYITWRDGFAGITATDACGTSTITVVEGAWTAPTVCTVEITVTFTATDVCGNDVSVDYTYTITDATIPFIINGTNGSAECQGTIPSANTDYIAWRDQFANASTNDVCGNSTLSYSEGSWVSIDPCTVQTTVTVTATDDCGLIQTAQFTFTITDTQEPVLTGGANGTGECEGTNPGQNTAYIAWRDGFAGITATDACGTSTITVVEGTWTAPTVCTDEITVTFTATDVCGTDVSVDYTYTITDVTVPFIISGANGTAECQGTIPGANTDYITWRDQFANASTNDVCDNSTLSYSEGSWVTIDDCTVQTTVTVTATDDCGLTGTADFTFTITDNQAPVLTGGANGTGECEGTNPGQNTAYIAWRDGFAGITATDACGTSTITVVEGTWTAPTVCTDEITVTFTATDVCGTDVSVDYTYTITDVTVPFIISGANGSAECQGTIPGANTDYIAWRDQFANASTNDVCGNSILSYTEGSWVTINACTVQTTVTVTATDDCGLTETADFTFTITDNQAPTASNPAPISVQCLADIPAPDPAEVIDEADICSTIPVVAFVSDVSDGNTCPEVITRTYSVTDNCGNSITVTQIITVDDDIPPTVNCPTAGFTTASDFNETFAMFSIPVFDYSDNCTPKLDIDISWIISGVTTGSGNGIIPVPYKFNSGVSTVTYTFTDDCGNSTTCVFTITVDSPPVITCQPDIIRNTDPDLCSAVIPIIPATATGAVVTITGVRSDGLALTDPYPLGTITITWTAINQSGSDACDQLITVVDNQPPTFDAGNKEFCVENLISATYNVNDNDIQYNPDYPGDDEYYLFRATENSIVLDIDPGTFSDNCCASFVPTTSNMRWTITFDDGSVISGTGQPSTYGADIQLPGDGINFNYRTHTITYWITDCNGVESLPVTRNIIITPRPKIIKMN